MKLETPSWEDLEGPLNSFQLHHVPLQEQHQTGKMIKVILKGLWHLISWTKLGPADDISVGRIAAACKV